MGDFVRVVAVRLRSLLRAPAYTLPLLLTIVLAVTGAASVAEALREAIYRPLGLRAAERLVAVAPRSPSSPPGISALDLADFEKRAKTLASVTAFVWSSANLAGDPGRRVRIADVRANWFSTLGMALQLGRGLNAGSDVDSRSVVLSDQLWRTAFGADAHVVGTKILLDGGPYLVVGVAGTAPNFPTDADLWRLMALTPEAMTCRGCPFLIGPLARLRNNASVTVAEAEVNQVLQSIKHENSGSASVTPYRLISLRQNITGDIRPAVAALIAAVLCIVLIACANVGMLQMVRATVRANEHAIRVALGATPRGTLLTAALEPIIVALVGAVLGVGLAVVVVRVFVTVAADNFPLLRGAGIDYGFLIWIGFSVAAMAAIAALLGLSTAVPNVFPLTRRGAGTSTVSIVRRDAIIVGEVALALPILVAACLLLRSFERLSQVELGFNADSIVRFDLALAKCGTTWVPDSTCAGSSGRHFDTPAAIAGYKRELLRSLSSLPGTHAAAIGYGVPLTCWARNKAPVTVLDPSDGPKKGAANIKYVSPGYFRTLGIPIVRGRDFDEQDALGTPPVAIVNSVFARTFFGDSDPIGQRVEQFGRTFSIIGVAGDTRDENVTDPSAPALYENDFQFPNSWMTVVVRTSSTAGAIIRAVRERDSDLFAAAAPFNSMQLRDVVGTATAPARFELIVIAAFAVIAFVLAVVGVYGLIAFTVRSRVKELAVRMAIGAEPAQVRRLVLWWGARLGLAGTAVGLLLSVALSEIIASLLFDVRPLDVASYLSTTILVCGAAVAASWVPAALACRLDPTTALRSD